MEAAMHKIWTYFWLPETKYIIAVVAILALLSLRLLPKDRQRIGRTTVVFVLCLVGQLFGALLEALDHSRFAVMVHELFVIGSGMALCRLVAIFVFRIILPRFGIVVARIAEDVIVIAVYAAFILGRLHIVGLDPSSLLTTSAVITAVLAFAMQDTLGNILSGVALQLDNSLRTGDWVKVDDVTGRVAQIRWRQTTIRTRNGEVVVVPNSQLMRGRFTVFGRADIPNWPWRRWIWFNITYDSPPTLVIQKVEKAISTADIPNVAREPAPTCVLMEFGQGYGRYALRYWMLDPQPDDPTDSAVRVHVLAALQRARMELAVPEQSLHITKENDAYRKSLQRREIERRIADLHKLELFSSLQEEELRTISERMVYAPFACGDVIFHQPFTATLPHDPGRGNVRRKRGADRGGAPRHDHRQDRRRVLSPRPGDGRGNCPFPAGNRRGNRRNSRPARSGDGHLQEPVHRRLRRQPGPAAESRHSRQDQGFPGAVSARSAASPPPARGCVLLR